MQEEQYAQRDGTYSAWHRRLSTRRFVGLENAQRLAMIDIDACIYVEYSDDSKEPLALIEVAKDVGQTYKNHKITQRLAMRCVPVLPAYVVLYTPGEQPNPADRKWPDISKFRALRIWPNPTTEWRIFTPSEWAKVLLGIRDAEAKKLDEIIDDLIKHSRPVAAKLSGAS